MRSLSAISSRDLEALSAYLDGQLASKQVARVERRLREEQALREALEELRLVKRLAGTLPVERPPRSFALTPEMVGVRPRRAAYPALRLATALATVAFLAVSGLSLVTSARAPAMAPAPALEMLQAAEAPMAAPAEEAAVEAPQEPSAADLVVPSKTPESANRFAAEATQVVEAPGIGGAEGATLLPAEGTPAVFAAAPMATPTPTLGIEPTPTGLAEPEALAAVAPTQEGEAPAMAEAVSPQADETLALRPSAPALSWTHWLQLGLGGLVVVLAVLTLIIRRPRA